MPEHDDLARDLTELGRSLPAPAASGLETAVMARLDAPDRPRRWFGGSRARVVAAAAAVLVALLAAPPVVATVADWFGFGAVVVRQGDGGEPTTAGSPVSPPPVSPGTSFAAAAAQVDFAVFGLSELGEPGGAEVSADRRVLSLGWTGGIRLDQSSSLSFTFDKSARSVDAVSVDGRDALWFGDSHEVVLLGEDGSRIPETQRPAGRTLIWTIGDTTLRLEGDLSLAHAVELAESAERLD